MGCWFMSFVSSARGVGLGGFFFPPILPPAPLCPPPGAERGALIWLRRAGYASTTRTVASASSFPDWRACGRRELTQPGAPRLAAAPASDETRSTCLVHSRSRSDRCRWHTQASPFTTTTGQQCRPANHGGDASLHRSLSKTPTTKSRPPSLPPAGGREGRGGVWGERKNLPIQRLSQKKQKT